MQTFVFVEGAKSNKKLDNKKLDAIRKTREHAEQCKREEYLSELTDAIRYCFDMPASVYYRKYHMELCEHNTSAENPLDFDAIVDLWHATPLPKRHSYSKAHLTNCTYAFRVYTIHNLYDMFVKFDDKNTMFKFRDFENAVRKCILKKEPNELEMFPYPELCRDGYVVVALCLTNTGLSKLVYANPIAIQDDTCTQCTATNCTVEDIHTETVVTDDDGTTETIVEDTHTETSIANDNVE